MTTTDRHRRTDDTAVALIDQRVVMVEADIETIGAQLTKHVTECAAMQKKVLLMVVFVAGWIVAHSPEGIKVLGRVFSVVLP